MATRLTGGCLAIWLCACVTLRVSDPWQITQLFMAGPPVSRRLAEALEAAGLKRRDHDRFSVEGQQEDVSVWRLKSWMCGLMPEDL